MEDSTQTIQDGECACCSADEKNCCGAGGCEGCGENMCEAESEHSATPKHGESEE